MSNSEPIKLSARRVDTPRMGLARRYWRRSAVLEALRTDRSMSPWARHLAGGATVGLVLVLLSVGGFSLWSSMSTDNSVQSAISASQKSDTYEAAWREFSAAQSLGLKYRIDPQQSDLVQLNAASTKLLAGLKQLSLREDNPAAREEILQAIDAHGRFLDAVRQLRADAEAGRQVEILRSDDALVEDRLSLIGRIVESAAEVNRTAALTALHALQEQQTYDAQIKAIVFLGGALLVLGFTLVLRQVQRQLYSQRSQAMHDSRHDALTGLGNRNLLAERFDRALVEGRRKGSATGLLLIDLDRFKEVNDTLGHHFGDQLLKQIGARLAGALARQNTVVRLGGDEFAVLLPSVRHCDDANEAAEQIRQVLAAPFTIDGIELDVEASVGVVLSPDHGLDSVTLMQRADVAMYVAKAQSMGVFVYNADTDDHSPERLSLLGELRRGIDRGELLLHYQPKISVDSGVLRGVEALVRWQHPQRGLVAPDEFIPLAEHTGLIGPLTEYVLDAALAQIRSWLDAGYNIPVSVNLSTRNLLDDQLPMKILNCLERHRVPVCYLELEVTESAIMTDPARAHRILSELHECGFKLSIDDFGAGYTSLAQLKTLPVTELKVDRSFVIAMDTDTSNALIVQSVIALGHNLGLIAVAEGVESAASMAALAGYGCDIAQGYHLSRPLSAAAFLTWYVEHNRQHASGLVVASPAGRSSG